jgi:hypothetical protein
VAGTAADVVADWDRLSPAEFQRQLQRLGDWVTATLVLKLDYSLPWCWPHHPAMVDELRALRDWHLSIKNDPVHGAEDLLRFHDALRRRLNDWPKPCPKSILDSPDETRDRLQRAEILSTQRMLDRVSKAEYLKRTKSELPGG